MTQTEMFSRVKEIVSRSEDALDVGSEDIYKLWFIIADVHEKGNDILKEIDGTYVAS